MPDVQFINQSLLSLLSKCGMMAYYRVVEGIREPPAIALIEGTAAHGGIGANLSEKIATGALLPEEAVADVAANTFQREWDGREGDPVLDEDERRMGIDRVLGQSKDRAVRMAVQHARVIAPTIEPIAVEREIVVDVPGFPYKIKGTLDVQERTRIRDSKTSGKKKTQRDAERSVQLAMYTELVRIADGVAPTEVCLDVMIKPTTSGRVDTQVLIAPAPTDPEPLRRRIEAAAHVLHSGAFYPVDPTGPGAWICTEKFCGYYHRCPYGARAQVVIPAPDLGGDE